MPHLGYSLYIDLFVESSSMRRTSVADSRAIRLSMTWSSSIAIPVRNVVFRLAIPWDFFFLCVCVGGLPYSCDAGQLKCPGTGLCIEPEQLCDFSDDCLNGKEEKWSECLEKKVDDSFCTIF